MSEGLFFYRPKEEDCSFNKKILFIVLIATARLGSVRLKVLGMIQYPFPVQDKSKNFLRNVFPSSSFTKSTSGKNWELGFTTLIY
jgi:hypothetical protein